MASVKDILRSAGGSVAEKLLIPPALIDVEPGFNIRIPGAELDEHINGLADLIQQNGFDPTQPISVSRAGDRFVVRSGHCRFAAVRLVLDRGVRIVTIPALLEPQGTNEADRAYQIGTQNGAKPLSDLEYGALVKRLRGYGQSDDDILRGFGKKRPWLERILDLAGASPDVHRAVARKEISSTEAVRVVRANGAAAGAVIARATEHARAEGRERARPRDVAAVSRPRTEAPSTHGVAEAAALAWVRVDFAARMEVGEEFSDAMERLCAKFGLLVSEDAA